MKYLLTKSQFRLLKEELMIHTGSMDFNPIYNTISMLNRELGEDVIKKDTQEYLLNVIGLDDREITKLLGPTYNTYKLLPKNDLICGLIYYITKKHYNLVEVGELSYHQSYISNWYRNYFDEELETFVGFMSLFKKTFMGYKCFKISGIQVANKSKSRGYGKSMYLSLFDDVDVIVSDDQIFDDSLNIWVNVLPKYSYVWLIDSYGKPKRVSIKGDVPIYENYEFFVASKNNIFNKK